MWTVLSSLCLGGGLNPACSMNMIPYGPAIHAMDCYMYIYKEILHRCPTAHISMRNHQNIEVSYGESVTYINIISGLAKQNGLCLPQNGEMGLFRQCFEAAVKFLPQK